MVPKVEIFPQFESSNITIAISTDKIHFNFNFNYGDNSKNLAIEFVKIEGANACVFTMDSEDIDAFLLKNSHKPIEERWYSNVITREKDEFQLQLRNARVFMKYNEAVEFYEIVDSLDDEIKKLSSISS